METTNVNNISNKIWLVIDEANIDGEALLSDRFDIEMIPAGIRLEYNPVFVESMLK